MILFFLNLFLTHRRAFVKLLKNRYCNNIACVIYRMASEDTTLEISMVTTELQQELIK